MHRKLKTWTDSMYLCVAPQYPHFQEDLPGGNLIGLCQEPNWKL